MGKRIAVIVEDSMYNRSDFYDVFKTQFFKKYNLPEDSIFLKKDNFYNFFLKKDNYYVLVFLVIDSGPFSTVYNAPNFSNAFFKKLPPKIINPTKTIWHLNLQRKDGMFLDYLVYVKNGNESKIPRTIFYKTHSLEANSFNFVPDDLTYWKKQDESKNISEEDFLF